MGKCCTIPCPCVLYITFPSYLVGVINHRPGDQPLCGPMGSIAQVFKLLGKAGFLGVNKPVEYGGLGLDFSYSIAVSEELGNIRCGGIPMAIGVQTDMATPALARFGSEELKKEFLLPSITGDKVACLGVSEVGAGSDVATIKTNVVRKGVSMW
ncbi:unnamed protein product [Oncorhynchus mykiss]|uniref:Acyl-CoA dehydrogenase/oxidase N-terminal domain-containing protein n=1 Tax=Oncorhynchus mykiss TaxID=8022 RepID=A0A060Y6Q1_ONCMY|nr:unnamed protein product [Oncorhynchus mykiss]